mmetsp:Transcript_106276/g.307614  ORF Transcript_106276/g.307614 Transcript_106276/m.307614 type:complete len:95 (+) Transcript_106276:58-342(+)
MGNAPVPKPSCCSSQPDASDEYVPVDLVEYRSHMVPTLTEGSALVPAADLTDNEALCMRREESDDNPRFHGRLKAPIDANRVPFLFRGEAPAAL